jgi:anaerobic selenocysteine-containing dehydrogenase
MPIKQDTICRLCSACCPIEVETHAGRLVAAARKSFLPPSQRLSCDRLEAAADIIYSPHRLVRPLIKDRSKAGGDFREATWDEALNRIATRFHRFKRRYGAESIAWLRGMAADWGAPWDYVNRLMNAFGSPNSLGNGSLCHVARDLAHVLTYGAMTVPQPKNARCIVVWGKNDRHTCPAVHEGILQGLQQGAHLIVVDPIRTELAARADIWLQVKPSHDGPLAMAMIEHILAESLYDQGFVRDWSSGFDELQQACRPFAADRIAGELWLDPGDIKAAARLYARNSPACIIDGNGLDMQLEVFEATRAVCCLRSLTGNLDRIGGDVLPQPVPARNIQLRERLPASVPPVTCQYPLFNRFSPTWGHQVQSCLIDAILEEKPYPVRMLVVQAGNPAVTMTDSSRVRKALEKLEFIVVIDLFMTRTAHFADVVLPAASCFEKTQLNRASLRNNLVVLQNQVVDGRGESWPDWKIIFELGRKLGLEKDFPWRTVEEAIDYQLAPAGITVEKLRQNPDGLTASEIRYQKHLQEGFATSSGKVEFFSTRLREQGHEPVPYKEGWSGNPISFTDHSGDYPFVGINGARTGAFTHSQFHRIPSLLKEEPEGCIDLHPGDAELLGVIAGDLIEVETPRGKVHMKARLSGVVRPGSIRIAWGWGEVDPAANLNNLTDDERRSPVTGTPGCRSFMCRVKKVESCEAKRDG